MAALARPWRGFSGGANRGTGTSVQRDWHRRSEFFRRGFVHRFRRTSSECTPHAGTRIPIRCCLRNRRTFRTPECEALSAIRSSSTLFSAYRAIHGRNRFRRHYVCVLAHRARYFAVSLVQIHYYFDELLVFAHLLFSPAHHPPFWHVFVCLFLRWLDYRP